VLEILSLLADVCGVYRAAKTAKPKPRRAVFTGIAASMALHIVPLLLAVPASMVHPSVLPGFVNFTVSWGLSIVAIRVGMPEAALVGIPVSAFTDLLVCYFCVMFAEGRKAVLYMFLILVVLHAANVCVGMFNWSAWPIPESPRTP